MLKFEIEGELNTPSKFFCLYLIGPPATESNPDLEG